MPVRSKTQWKGPKPNILSFYGIKSSWWQLLHILFGSRRWCPNEDWFRISRNCDFNNRRCIAAESPHHTRSFTTYVARLQFDVISFEAFTVSRCASHCSHTMATVPAVRLVARVTFWCTPLPGQREPWVVFHAHGNTARLLMRLTWDAWRSLDVDAEMLTPVRNDVNCSRIMKV